MPRLKGYRFSRLVVDGEEQTRDLVVLPSGSPPTWGRTDGHALVLDDHQDVRAELPEQLVVGTGGYTPILRP
jgi:hypothetical protein